MYNGIVISDHSSLIFKFLIMVLPFPTTAWPDRLETENPLFSLKEPLSTTPDIIPPLNLRSLALMQTLLTAMSFQSIMPERGTFLSLWFMRANPKLSISTSLMRKISLGFLFLFFFFLIRKIRLRFWNVSFSPS